MRIAVIDELLALYYSQPGTKGHCLTVLDHPLLHYYSLTQYSKLNSSLQVHSILAVLTQVLLRAIYPLSFFTLHPSIRFLSHFQFLSQSLKYSVSLQTTRHVSRQFILPDYLPLCVSCG